MDKTADIEVGDNLMEAGDATVATIEIGGQQFPLVDGMPRASSRSASSVIPAALVAKIRSQTSRLTSIRKMAQRLNAEPQPSVDQARQMKSELEELYATFTTEHAILESACTVPLLGHKYFAEDAVGAAYECYSIVIQDLVKLISNSNQQDSSANSANSQAHSNAQPGDTRPIMLPKILLPQFSGNSTDWAGFKQLFTTYIIEEKSLVDLQRLYYLRASLTEAPAELVKGFPLAGESFKLSWNALLQHYDNKTFVLAQNLNAIRRLTLKSTQSHHAASLEELVTEYQRLRKSILTMGTTEEVLQSVFTHMLLALLDKPTREAWELTHATDSSLLNCDELEKFLMARVRALELAAVQRRKQRFDPASIFTPNYKF